MAVMQTAQLLNEQAARIRELEKRIADLEEYVHLTEYWAGLEVPDQKERRVYIAKLFPVAKSARYGEPGANASKGVTGGERPAADSNN